MSTLIILLVVISEVLAVTGKTIHVWRDSDSKSDKADVEIATCSNLPAKLAGEVSSIDTRNQCARLWAGINCTGEATEILPRSPQHNDLRAWNFNDRTVSVGPCLDPCDIRVTGDVPQKPINITIFDRTNFKGAYVTLPVTGCSLVPTQFVFRFHSVDTKGRCVQLWRNVKCETKYPQGTFDYDTIELRKGSPRHNDIGAPAYGWWFQEVRAVSHCSYKCNNRTDLEEGGTRNGGYPGIGEIVIFDNANFEGHWTTVKLKEGCVNLEGVWEGVPVSVRAYPDVCVTLYDRRDCEGKSYNVITQEGDLASRNFEGVTRSMGYCNWGFTRDLEGTPGRGKRKGGYVLSTVSITVIAVSLLVIFGVSTGSILVLWRKLRRSRKLSEREIRDFLNGLARDVGDHDSGIGGGTSDTESHQYYDFGGWKESQDHSGEDLEVAALQKAYDVSYEVERRRFSFDKTLGMGQFGVVYQGRLQTRGNDKMETSVAVKTLKSHSTIENLRSLMREVKVMLFISELGEHSNVVRVVGCCTELLKEGDLFLLMEHCSHGSLKGFLQQNGSRFRNLVKNGRIYRKAAGYEGEGMGTLPESFDLFQQLQWAHDIASGMEFLSASKVLHRDLAARNILLDDHFCAKISDFGLSRKMYNYNEYSQKGEDPVPWKWLPPESLLKGKFSTKSDVWSFGVTCWEVFSLGEEPYAGEVWGKEFSDKVASGYRLAMPPQCVLECYQLMLNCWNFEPSCRPTFADITRQLEHVRELVTKIVLSEEGEQYTKRLPTGYVETFVIAV